MTTYNDDLHELTASEYCDDVVKKGLSIEFDVALDLVETSKNIPHLGSAVKLFQVGAYIYEFKRYYEKLATFLKHALDIPLEERQKFINSWNPTMRSKAAEYIISVLTTAEDTDKAEVLGLLYKARLLNEIGDEMLLRLTSIVNRIYIRDLRLIDVNPDTVCQDDDNIISNFTACGMIADQTGMWHNNELRRNGNGSFACHFNSAGETLYNILKKAGWYD